MDVLRKIGAGLAMAACALFLAQTSVAAEKRVSIDGFGLLGNAELRSALRLLEIEEGELDAQKMEDGAFLLANRLRQSGYLDARISATITLVDGSELAVSWPAEYEPQIDAKLVARAIQYQVDAGQLYFYEDVVVNGELPISEDEASAYFIPDTTLYSRKKDKSFSPSIFAGQQKQLIAALVNLGYQDARVVDESTQIDRSTGGVTASLAIDKGPLYRVRSLQTSIFENGQIQSREEASFDEIYNRAWVDEQTRLLRNQSYHLGFPDTRIASRIAASERKGDVVEVTMQIEARRGRRYRIASIEHIGATDTFPLLLERKVRMNPGDLLDITAVEAARRRLSRIGIFRRVDLEFKNADTDTRSVIFNYENGQRVEWQLLAGYGSYEQFRLGVIGRRSNLFGRAHSLSFEAIKSMKSTTGKLTYAVPEIFGEAIDGKFEANALDREELYFDRKERGVSLGLSTRLERMNLDLGVDYGFERKQSSDPRFNADLRLEDTNIGSLLFRAAHSTVDNVLYPSAGYEVYAATRYAAKELGGQTEFTRPEIGVSYHKNLSSRWLTHLSAKGGMVTSPAQNSTEIPNTERFLVGGENSLRGFRRGEAGPIDDEGIPIGAEAFGLINAELEYPLFDKLSAVLFVDAARVWSSTEQFGTYDDFVDVGLGLRYRTIVGPVRLEYGRNINARPSDPLGTLHLSIGFPF